MRFNRFGATIVFGLAMGLLFGCTEKKGHDDHEGHSHGHKKNEVHDNYQEAIEDCQAHSKKIGEIFKKGDLSKAHTQIEALGKAVKGLPALATKEIPGKAKEVTSTCADLTKLLGDLEKAAHSNKKTEATQTLTKLNSLIGALEKYGEGKGKKHDHKH